MLLQEVTVEEWEEVLVDAEDSSEAGEEAQVEDGLLAGEEIAKL